MARFPVEEYGRRLDLVRQTMVERGLAAQVVVGAENIHYLTALDCQGFFALNALVVPAVGTPMLVTRAMEHPTVAAQAVGCAHLPYTDVETPADGLVRAVFEVTDAGDQIGVERDLNALPPLVWDTLRARLVDRDLVDGSGVVEAARLVPSAAEVACARQAAATTSAAMRAGIETVKEGASERDVAAAVYQAMITAGSDYPGFVPLIRTRDRLLQEHVTWSDRILHSGDALFLELSGCVGRYHAPMTRMVYVGEPPAGTERAGEIAVAGLHAVRDAMRPGVSGEAVYEAWQQVVDEGLGHDRYRRHHCGYLVGLGFPPSWVGGSRVKGLRPGSELVLAEGMTFHVLSWLLGQDPADFVVSDTVLVTASGGEILTEADREPIVVG
ncbi:MAG: M24 family metallopeptidase [Streptosporangiales bacterium]|nr:M24 family metallopeptidase [Streptosporangiales bacterium]